MRLFLHILTIAVLLTACHQPGTSAKNMTGTDTLDLSGPGETSSNNEPVPAAKRLSYHAIKEVVTNEYNCSWMKVDGDNESLELHFMYKDTLVATYSMECGLFFPYKYDDHKIVVYWDQHIDTKYNFEMVKAIQRTDKKLIGKPFMILELENDTTLKATYLLKDLIKTINSSSKERTFFPDTYRLIRSEICGTR